MLTQNLPDLLAGSAFRWPIRTCKAWKITLNESGLGQVRCTKQIAVASWPPIDYWLLIIGYRLAALDNLHMTTVLDSRQSVTHQLPSQPSYLQLSPAIANHGNNREMLTSKDHPYKLLVANSLTDLWSICDWLPLAALANATSIWQSWSDGCWSSMMVNQRSRFSYQP